MRARGVEVGSRFVRDVVARRAGRLVDAQRRGQRHAGYPQPSPGTRRGSAEFVGLLQHHDLGAMKGRGDGGGHARGARAYDDHVDGGGQAGPGEMYAHV
ncbi:Uncharacterised protein [Bordetella pertussis]|nr:Uncharacterised protein [Bordetella pertussis]CFW43468.1 Uncharacterised protein [Bordetella pertussis]